MRLRQVALIARDLEPAVGDLCEKDRKSVV